MTRIIGGRWRGRRLTTPKGLDTRPTSDKVRGAIANALAATGGLDGAAVLDLYAGTGALGLELASRGAASVVLVEHARRAQTAIRSNLELLTASDVTLFPGTALSYSKTSGPAFDIVVADPPYAEPAEVLQTVLTELHTAGRVHPAAEIVIERSAREPEFLWPDPFVDERVRRYGDTVICYGRAP